MFRTKKMGGSSLPAGNGQYLTGHWSTSLRTVGLITKIM